MLSGGERGRVALARQIVQPADLLILDEPTNHLDLDTTRWLEQYLRESDRTQLIVSHDRAFLEAVSDHVLHMEGGTAFSYVGGYTAFVQQREERRLTQLRQFEQQKKKIEATQDYIARNLAGQNTAQAKGRRKLLARMPRLSAPIGAESVMALRLAAGDRSGDRVLETEKLALRVQDRTLLSDVTLVMPRNEVIALVGPNGAGKSTFIKTVLGERAPDGGTAKLGLSTTVAYYRQDLAHLALDSTIHDAITTLRPFWERREVHGHLGRFGFGGDESQRVIGSLSGGERARVALALLTLSRANLLVLDEPTNHLDVESIEAIEDAIDGYDGTVLIVSHDRAVLRGLATRVWEIRDGAAARLPGAVYRVGGGGGASGAQMLLKWRGRSGWARRPPRRHRARSAQVRVQGGASRAARCGEGGRGGRACGGDGGGSRGAARGGAGGAGAVRRVVRVHGQGAADRPRTGEGARGAREGRARSGPRSRSGRRRWARCSSRAHEARGVHALARAGGRGSQHAASETSPPCVRTSP